MQESGIASSIDNAISSTIACPNCRAEMTAHAVAVFYKPHPVEIGICSICNLLWFGQAKSISLTPQAVLELFRCIAQADTTARMPYGAAFCCPQCAKTLSIVHDRQHTTRFAYWCCPTNHGQLFSYSQFLLEKNFVRSPSTEELAKLRAMVRQISCSQCGGSIDLSTDTACPHCGSAIALIDPDGVAKAVHDMTAAHSKTIPVTTAQTHAAIATAHQQALADRLGAGDREERHDLLSIGLAAVSALLSM